MYYYTVKVEKETFCLKRTELKSLFAIDCDNLKGSKLRYTGNSGHHHLFFFYAVIWLYFS